MKGTEAAFLPRGNDEDFRAALRSRLKLLGFKPNYFHAQMVDLARQFLRNRQLDVAPTDASILRSISEAIERPNDRLGAHMCVTDEAVVVALCSEFPGHRYQLEIPSDAGRPIFLPDNSVLLGEAVKAGWRREAEPGARGIVLLDRQIHSVAQCVPKDVDAKSLTAYLCALSDAIAAVETEVICSRPYLAHFGLALARSSSPKGSDELAQAIIAVVSAHDEGLLPCCLKTVIPGIVDVWLALDQHAAARAFCVDATEQLLVDENILLAGRRRILKILAEHFPTQVRLYLRDLRRRIKVQYGGEGDKRGKQRSAHRWIAAHASWRLICGVLDLVWQPQRGPLTKKYFPAIRDICNAVLDYADPTLRESSNGDDDLVDAPWNDEAEERVPGPNRANFVISTKHISTIASLRLNIHELKEMLIDMDRRLLFEMIPLRERQGLPPAPEEDDLRRRIEALQTWRRELERRLRHGDYERGPAAAHKKRVTGPRIEIPSLSLQIKRLAMEERSVAASDLALAMGLDRRPRDEGQVV